MQFDMNASPNSIRLDPIVFFFYFIRHTLDILHVDPRVVSD